MADLDTEDLGGWIGARETATGGAHREPLAGLSALLDHETPPWPDGCLPPLGHWLYFLPRARASEIDVDGHPKRGGFLPPVELPRRMWAGGEIEFHAPIAIGADMRRESTIRDIRRKTGKTGALVFVTVAHEIWVGERLAISERQDLVYREPAPIGMAAASSAPPASARPADVEREAHASPVDLFRFSALTFNGHRIHYDRDYARDVEGYGGLVVHGPFTATLLMDLLLRSRPGAEVERFAFRGVRPLLDVAPFTLCLAWEEAGAALWCRDASGHETMTATAVLR
jgi:3-methylfumaryl-CoA hydratase